MLGPLVLLHPLQLALQLCLPSSELHLLSLLGHGILKLLNMTLHYSIQSGLPGALEAQQVAASQNMTNRTALQLEVALVLHGDEA